MKKSFLKTLMLSMCVGQLALVSACGMPCKSKVVEEKAEVTHEHADRSQSAMKHYGGK